MYSKYIVLAALLLATNSIAVFRFSNLKCTELDPPFANFEKCKLKLIKRGVVSMNLHVKLNYPKPVRNITVSAALYKRASGYRPFLYNVTTDFCTFMRNTKKIPQLKILAEALKNDSNINHTCPYNHDIIVDNLVLQENMFNILPLPAGDYMIKIMVAAYNHWKADVSVYMDINAPAI